MVTFQKGAEVPSPRLGCNLSTQAQNWDPQNFAQLMAIPRGIWPLKRPPFSMLEFLKHMPRPACSWQATHTSDRTHLPNELKLASYDTRFKPQTFISSLQSSLCCRIASVGGVEAPQHTHTHQPCIYIGLPWLGEGGMAAYPQAWRESETRSVTSQVNTETTDHF